MHEPDLTLEKRSITCPRILLTDSNRWPAAARLAIALNRLGCEIGVLCRTPGHPAQKVRSVTRVFNYEARAPFDSLLKAIEEFDPDLVVPCCDRSVQHLHQLHQTCSAAQGSQSRIAALIERSLGSPDGFSITSSRFELLKLAQSEGILVPEFAKVSSEAELLTWNKQSAVPWVMKADVTSGGQGVQFANSAAEASQFLLSYSRRLGITELIKRLTLNRDWAWIVSEWRHSRRQVIAQSTINGRPANCAVFCWQGDVLACVAVEVIKSHGATGPATLVQVVEGTEMISAAEKIAKRLGMSGFFGLDFVIEEGTRAIYLIEMNPRCTPPCPLDLGPGRNLVAALCSKVSGKAVPQSQPSIEQTTIAYFPQVEEGAGTLDGTGRNEPVHLDIPSGEPDLIRELLSPRPQRTVAGQLVDRLRRKETTRTVALAVFKDAGTSPTESAMKHDSSDSTLQRA